MLITQTDWLLLFAPVVMFFTVGVIRELALGFVSIIAGAADALAGPVRRGFDVMGRWLSRSGQLKLVDAVLHVVLIASFIVAAMADYAVLRDTIRVVWPTGLSPRPLALGIVVLTAALGYLLHKAGGPWVRLAILAVLIGLTGVQGVLAWKRADDVGEVEALARAAVGAAQTGGSIVIGGEAGSAPPGTNREGLPALVPRLFDTPLLSAIIATFLAAAGALTAWGVAAFTQGEIVWYLCSPIFGLMILTLTITSFLTRMRQPLSAAINRIVDPVLIFRARLLGFLRSLVPWTADGAEHRGRRAERRHQLAQSATKRQMDAEHQRHEAAKAEAQRENERGKLAHEEKKRDLDRRYELSQHQARLSLRNKKPETGEESPSPTLASEKGDEVK